MSTPPRELIGKALELAAGHDSTPERLEAVAPRITGVYAMLGALDDVPLGETPPATAFDARWE